MRLVDMEVESEKVEWEVSGKKKESAVYYKVIRTYDDARRILDNYKLGALCIYSLEPQANPDAQAMMSYICGGAYVLEGNVTVVGENIFLLSSEPV